jgi:hypothetical protein
MDQQKSLTGQILIRDPIRPRVALGAAVARPSSPDGCRLGQAAIRDEGLTSTPNDPKVVLS